jgi:ATP-dependent RNA helicase HelY
LQEVFGVDRVGLRTGDVSINPGAPIMVMTTEILRNISYRVLLQEGPMDASQDLSNVGLTVLDEVRATLHLSITSVVDVFRTSRQQLTTI